MAKRILDKGEEATAKEGVRVDYAEVCTIGTVAREKLEIATDVLLNAGDRSDHFPTLTRVKILDS